MEIGETVHPPTPPPPPEKGDLEVVVLDVYTDAPVDGVDIEVKGGPSSITDSNGRAHFSGLPAEVYDVDASKTWPDHDYITFLVHYPKISRDHKAESDDSGLAPVEPGDKAKIELRIEVYHKLEVVTLERRHIDLGGDDKYGHWWTVIDSESYGWWPKYPLGHPLNRRSAPPPVPPPVPADASAGARVGGMFAQILHRAGSALYAVGESGPVQTARGVEGELNGQTSFGGTATMDPHHISGDQGDERYQPIYYKGEDPAVLKDGMRSFATSFSGGWSWLLEAGTHCHSFQIDMMKRVGLSCFKEL